MTRKYRKNSEILCAGCSLLRAEGFSCNLDVLYGGLGISKLQFFDKKNRFRITLAVNFFQFFSFWSSKSWIRIGIQSKMLNLDPDSINPDQKHC
jgi:hypothetical protein